MAPDGTDAHTGDLRLILRDDDTDQAIADIAGVYAGKAWRARATGAPFSYRFSAVGDDQLSLRRLRMQGTLRGELATEDEHIVQWVERGEGRFDMGRDEVRLRRGIPAALPTGRMFAAEGVDHDQRFVHLDVDLVRDVLAGTGWLFGEPVFDHTTPVTAAAVRGWRTALSDASAALRCGTDSLVWHEARREVAAAYLQLSPPRGEDYPERFGTPEHARVRTVVEYLHEHAGDPITVGRLAEVAGCSVRTLQESFQRSLGESPMDHLRTVRLRLLHRDLAAADPDEATVAELARRWGFGHLGRLGGTYAARYGEYPNETLRRDVARG